MENENIEKLKSLLPASLLVVIPLKQNNIRRPRRVIKSLMKKLGDNLITAGAIYNASGEFWAIQLYLIYECEDAGNFNLLERFVLRKYKDVGTVVLKYVEYIGFD